MSTEVAASRAPLVNRMRRAEGQLRGVQRMLAEGAPPNEVLPQLAAVKAAVDQVGLHLIGERLRVCVEDETGACSAEFEQAVATFMRYTTLAR